MQENRWAVYQEKEYSASIRADGSILLRSMDEEDLKKGFQMNSQKNSKVKCFQYVQRNEIKEIYDVVVTAEYHGYECDVIEEHENKILIQIHNLLEEEAAQLHMDYAADK